MNGGGEAAEGEQRKTGGQVKTRDWTAQGDMEVTFKAGLQELGNEVRLSFEPWRSVGPKQARGKRLRCGFVVCEASWACVERRLLSA